MADTDVINTENIDALLNTSMEAEETEGTSDPTSNLDLMEDALLGQDENEGEEFSKCEEELIAERETMNSNQSAETHIADDTTGEVEFKVENIEIESEVIEPKVEAEEPSETCELNTVTNVTVTTPEEQDDIIILDDEEEEEKSSVSEAKRPRNELDDEIMEIDENDAVSTDDKESVGKVVRKMSRQDLEDLVLAKIVEAVVAHTEVGKLRAKVLELQSQKDKMAGKMGIMMKQVAELSSAVNIIMENEMRDPRNRVGKTHVIRFNRSVGLQTSIEPSVRSAPPKIIRVPEPAQNGVKQYGASTGKTPVYAGANGTFSTPQTQGVKRVYQGSKSLDAKHGLQSNSQIQSPRKVYSPASSGGPPRMHPIAPKPASGVAQSSIAIPQAQSFQPGIVDLTDDDPPIPSSGGQNITSQTVTNSGASTTIINGIQYQIVNRGATSSGVQIVSPGAQTPKYIVTSGAGQNRPVLLQQLAVGTAQQLPNNQQIMLRGVNNTAPVTIIQRPVAPRPTSIASNGTMMPVPRVAATIPSNVRPGNNAILGTASNTQKRFILPPLPATPPHKVKNDMYRAPPKPELTLNEQADGIVLSWNLPTVNNMAEVTTYQIFACQESMTNNSNRPSQWKRVGDVKALPLPMACTLSQFTDENRYYFIVRGIDVYGRVGSFCDPQNILLRRKK